MVRIERTNRALLHATLMLIVTSGCESGDARLADYARHATEQQARQNQQIAEQSQSVGRQSQELTSAAHELVEQDAVARRELIQAQDNLQRQLALERSNVDRQREQVAIERSAAVIAAIREPIIGQALIAIGWILAALLPLLITAYALRRLPDQSPVDELLTETLIEELTGTQHGLHSPDV